MAWFVLLVAALLASSCAGRDNAFDATRARAHVDMLATTIGSRPVGSAANLRARTYLIDQLSQLGFAVRVQEADAIDARRGLTAHVFNVIAVREGAVPDAIALVSHYDSVPDGPGALDDGLGVATCLESARVLASQPMRHALFVLLTDGEELGLMGARAMLKDPDVAGRLRAFLNFDGTGAAGPPLLFEIGPGIGSGLSAWATGAVEPAGASFGTEIYKRLPNDTDFSVLESAGAIGLNFAPVGDSYAYHTDRDRADRLQIATIREEGQNAVGIVRALDTSALAARAEAATFFDVAGWRGIVYGEVTTRLTAWGACLLAGAAWWWVTVVLWRARGWIGVVVTAIWSVLFVAATAGGMVAAAFAVRAMRAELAPWYASPQWLVLFVVASGGLSAWLMTRLVTVLHTRARPWQSPLVIWWATLPVWLALTVLLETTAPTAAYLVALPLGTIGVALLATRLSLRPLRAISFIVAAMAAVLAIGKLIILLGFLVALFGWLPVVTPVWLFPAVVGAGALMILPPFVGAAMGLSLWRASSARLGGGLAIAVLACGTLAYLSPAYTVDRPLRRSVRYVQDDVRHVAWWEISSMEPALGIEPSVPAGASWQRVTDAPPASVPMSRAPWMFTFRASAPSLVAAPAMTAFASLSPLDAGRATLSMSIAAAGSLAVRVVLPAGIVPIDSSLAGQVFRGQWSATYASPPQDTFTVRLVLGRPPADLLSRVLVELTRAGVPGAEAPGVPAWLSSPRATWQARSVFVIPAQPAPLARVGAP